MLEYMDKHVENHFVERNELFMIIIVHNLLRILKIWVLYAFATFGTLTENVTVYNINDPN